MFRRERGVPKDIRMAWAGLETESKADGYTKSADIKKAISGTESSNLFETSSNFGR